MDVELKKQARDKAQLRRLKKQERKKEQGELMIQKVFSDAKKTASKRTSLWKGKSDYNDNDMGEINYENLNFTISPKVNRLNKPISGKPKKENSQE